MILYKKNKLINGTNKYYYCYLKKQDTKKHYCRMPFKRKNRTIMLFLMNMMQYNHFKYYEWILI